MTTIAQVSDLTPLAGGVDSSAAGRALSWATSFIVGYCGRTFDLATDEVILVSPHFGSAFLPGTPIVNVSTVEAYLPNGGGMVWTTLTNYAVENDTGYIYDTTGLPGTTWGLGPTWPWLPSSLRVTYTHGYAQTPQGLIDVCCRLALQYLENPSLAMNSKVGEIEDRFSGSTGVKLNQLDQAILDRYSDAWVS